MMIGIQISLTREKYDAARQEAKCLGISLARLLLQSLCSSILVNGDKPWMRYAGMIESGDPKSSQHIDEIIYGHKP